MGACQSKKAFKAALKKRRMEKLSKGQRSSSGTGSPSKRTNSQLPTKSGCAEPTKASSRKGSPSPSLVSSSHQSLAPTDPSEGSIHLPSQKSKKAVKTSLREGAIKKNFQTRVKSTSQQRGTSSPSVIHGRALYKTAAVSPAPPQHISNNSANSSSSLTRFGFKRNSLITSGESTDSVNSILSDAQTTSDSNSNIFDFCEENGNTHPFQDQTLTLDVKQITLDNRTNERKVRARDASPCTISEASSGVTSSALANGKLTTQTKQLPKPQVATVKSFNSKKQDSHSRIPDLAIKKDTVANKNRNTNLPNSNLVMPKVQASKIPQTKSSLQRAQRTMRDSGLSSKSTSAQDSGLGSSLEGDRIKTGEVTSTTGLKKPVTNVAIKEHKSILEDAVNTIEAKTKFDLDISDAWLKDKHSTLPDRSKSFGLIGGSSQNGNVEKTVLKDSFKEKRDTTITYGMARQKFAPYNRNRYGYQSSSSSRSQVSTSGGLTKFNSIQSTKNINTGLVRSRVAEIEKTPPVIKEVERSGSTGSCKSAQRRPVARPTAIEKSPILVTSASENTVQLSRPVCRRLEYSEGKSSLLDTVKDNKNDKDSKGLSPTAQDILIVASYEMKKDKQKNLMTEHSKVVQLQTPPLLDTVLSKLVLSPTDKVSDSESDEGKRLKDISECEKPTKRELEESGGGISKNNSSDSVILDANRESEHNLEPSLKRDEPATTKLSPNESESSFEIIDSPSVDAVKEINAQQDYLSQLVVDMASKATELNASAKHSQESPIRSTPMKKSRNDSKNIDADHDVPKLPFSKLFIKEDASPTLQRHITTPLSGSSLTGSQNTLVMSTSRSNTLESSTDTPRMSDSCERSTISGKCTPTLSTHRSEMDQDFLIDDEISDQPGLTFGDDLVASFYDDDLFPEDFSSNSPVDLSLKNIHVRSRHESVGTASSISTDDLMLDYESEESKATKGGKSSSVIGQSAASAKPLHIHIPGPRYEEEVMSPSACEIFHEWSAMISQVQEPSDSPSQLCITEEPSAGNATVATGMGISPHFSGIISHHQSLCNGIDPATDAAEFRMLSSGGFYRTRTTSATLDYPSGDPKKGVIFKPPRQSAVSDQDGSVTLDRTSYHYICQDVTAVKTLLFKLKRMLQVADTINPFDPNLKANVYLSLGADDSMLEKDEPSTAADLTQENVDLKRQVVLLQQRLEEKDRSIRILQQQLSQTLQQQTSSSSVTAEHSANPCHSKLPLRQCLLTGGGFGANGSLYSSTCNAATQTERSSHRSTTLGLASMSRTSSVEDGLGPTVSSDPENYMRLLYHNFDDDFTDEFGIKKPPTSPPSGVHQNPSSRKIPIVHPPPLTPTEHLLT